MTSQGTLVYNGATYPMVYKQLPTNSSGFIVPTEVGTGDLTVNSGTQWSGSYPSAIVYQDSNGYLWVWPSGQFSMVSTMPEGTTITTPPTGTGSGTGTGTGTGIGTGTGTGSGTGTTTTYFGLSAIEIVIIVGIVAAVIITYVLTRKK